VIVAYWTLWAVNNWFDIAAEQLLVLSRSGFPGRVELHVVEGTEFAVRELNYLVWSFGLQINIVAEPANRAEYPALSALKQFCDQNAGDHQVLYFHGKNVSLRGVYGTKWRWAMMHAVIVEWKDRLKDLLECDAVGFCLKNDRAYGWIFAGNFWWANASWIRRLSSPRADAGRFHCEQWLFTKPGIRAKSLVSQGGDPHTYDYYPVNDNPQNRLIRFLTGKFADE
jgi:hypothetical protein